MTHVAMIGLGSMGGAMARRLASTGHHVTGSDPDETARERARAAGVEVADTPQEAVGAAEFVVSSLPNSAVLRSVWLGPAGLAGSLRAPATIVEVSTVDPATMRDLAAATPPGVGVLDSPVSGGPEEAAAGTLTVLAGGADEVLSRARPVLDDLATAVHHTGEVGTASVVKLVNNLMSMVNVLAAAEAFAIGTAAGVDPQRLFDVLSVSGGTSSQFVKRFPWALAGDFTPRFTVALGLKDLSLVLDLARDVRVPAPVGASSRELFALADATGLGGDDCVSLLTMYRSWHGDDDTAAPAGRTERSPLDG